MTVVFTRTITPHPGHLDDTLKFAKKRVAALKKEFGLDIRINARFGGPVGQLALVSCHDDLGQMEKIRRKIMKGVGSGKIPQPKAGMVQNVEDQIWLRL